MCYLVLALYKKLNVKLGGYIISAIVVGIVTPFTKLLVSDNQALNWILDMTFGGFDVKTCILWSVAVLVVTDLLVQGYLRIESKIKSK